MIANPPACRPALAERLMKLEEVASLFNVEPRTVADWARTGKIPSLRTPGGQYRFHPADVEALLNAEPETAAHNENGPAGAATPAEPCDLTPAKE